ncbi:hypothetical protein BDN67DRAFT_1017145 [Paxillus ammoniavirescens]|nr:hypothetical protein BDN67DRAFT_1017145 [Paxillus ammoniavirescens]
MGRQTPLEFPWYDDLFGIWNGIPNFTAKITTSQPGTSRGANHLKLVATRRKATPPPDEDDGGDGMIAEDPQPASDVHMDWEGGGGEGEGNGEGDDKGEGHCGDGDDGDGDSGGNFDEEQGGYDMDIDYDRGHPTNKGKRKAMDCLSSASPEPFHIPDKGATTGYDSRHTGFQFAAAKAQAINSRTASCPPSSCAVSHPPSSRAPSSRAPSRPPSSRAPSHPHSSRAPSSCAASHPPVPVSLNTPISSAVMPTSGELGKRIRLDLQDQMSQAETTAASDTPGGQRPALVMERNHRLATKLNHVNREHDRQLQRDRMNLEYTNSQAAHDRELQKKEADIRLEEAKMQSVEQCAKEHLAKAEMLRLQLRLKGVDGNDVE